MIHFSLKKNLHLAGGTMALNVSTTIANGGFVGLYGPSGAGKTSILRMLAGFMEPNEGFIKFDDQEWFNSSKKINLPTQKRKIGFVFQDLALFPNMSVIENLQFALDKGESKAVVGELMNVTALEEFHNKRIHTLSGGQKQRVALARALVKKPHILLLDEPLSAIDDEMRYRLQHILLTIHNRYNLTTILVSHHISEIIRLCGQVIFLENGLIKNIGEPAEVFFSEKEGQNFRFSGYIIKIIKEDILFGVSILTGNQVVHLRLQKNQVTGLSKGDKVTVSADEFNPQIRRI